LLCVIAVEKVHLSIGTHILDPTNNIRALIDRLSTAHIFIVGQIISASSLLLSFATFPPVICMVVIVVLV